MLLVAAGAKALDPVGFAAGIEEYGIIRGALPTRLLATALITAEAGLGACLLLGVWYRRALAAATLMLLIFGAVIGWAWASGQQHGCGCFGSLVERTPSQALAEDGGFLILAALGFAWRPAAATARGAWRARAALGAALAGAVVPPMATRFLPPLAEGKSLKALGVEAYLPWEPPPRALYGFLEPLRQGPEAAALEALARDGVEVVALCSAEAEEIEAFRWSAGPSYQIVTVPRSVVRRLSGDRPGAFLIRDGNVQAVWRRQIPQPGKLSR